MKSFLTTLHTRLAPGSIVLFVDDAYHITKGSKLIHKKGSQDTWKQRTLENGEKFTILKNYYTKQKLTKIFKPYAKKLDIHWLTNFWVARYTLKNSL